MNPPEASSAIVDAIVGGGRKPQADAVAAIEGLTKIAKNLDMAQTANNLNDVRDNLLSDTFNLIVMGRFKTGKSTFLNALLGGTTVKIDLGGHAGPMVVDDLPATATLTGVRYAEEPYIKAWHFDKTSQSWSMDEYLRGSTLDTDERESQARFGHIREFEMGFPARLCQAGIVVYDSPGLDEHDTRTMVTKEATNRADAAIVLYRSDVLMGQGEMMNAVSLIGEGTRVFTVVNLFGGRAVDDRLRKFVWNRYVRDQLNGPDYTGQDLATQDIYFIDAELARAARYSGDAAGVERSGLLHFEQRLASFLLGNRQYIHLNKFVTLASQHSTVIEQQIDQRQTALRADQAKLREAQEAILPKLAAIRSRPAKLPRLFSRYKSRAEAEIKVAFTSLVAEIRRDLPGHIEGYSLPSGEKFMKALNQKKMGQEAADEISRFVRSRVEDWSQGGAADVLRPLVTEMVEEVADEVATIERKFGEIHLELTGWQVDANAGPVVSTNEKVVSAVASVLVGNPLGAVGAGAGGWRGAVGSAVGAFGTGLVLGLLGISSAVVFWPVALAGALLFGLIGGGIGLEKRIKAKAVEKTDEQLQSLPDQMALVISKNIADKFAEIEEEVTKLVTDLIDEEERNVREVVELNRMKQEDKERTQQTLTDATAALARSRVALQRALTLAQQVG
ncbi:dynamin family protein [Dactylosporangium sp. NPDC005572]|uniref:dynamin family protein n=1 Tax=Dactylosporangium sp. NPDC005572 TaxID=3156889 RepID=UPI00339F3152